MRSIGRPPAGHRPRPNPPEAVLFLDIDGTLAPFHAAGCDGYLKRDEAGLGVPYRQLLLQRLSRLHQSGTVEIRWLTTWQPAEVEAWHRVGFGPFQCANRYPPTAYGGWWKIDAVAGWLGEGVGRRAVWIDDDYPGTRSRTIKRACAGRKFAFLGIRPDSRAGLLDEDLDRAEAWLRVRTSGRA